MTVICTFTYNIITSHIAIAIVLHAYIYPMSLHVPSFMSDNSICNIAVTESTVLQKLLELKVNKAPGPDGMHSYVLKACANSYTL